MTRTKIRGYLERISDLEFQLIEPDIVELISKLPHSQLLIDFAHVLGHRSSSLEAADAIEQHILEAHYQTSGKKGIYLNIVKKIRDRFEEPESEKEQEAARLFNQQLLKLCAGLRLFLQHSKVSNSAQSLLALFEGKVQQEIESFDEYDYLNFLHLQRKLLLGFDSEIEVAKDLRSLIDTLQDEIQQLDINDPVY